VKPPPFSYHHAGSVAEAVNLLGEVGPSGKVLAGGQSLLQQMNLRLIRPAHLVDINGLSELDYVRSDNGTLAIGACTRQSTLERSAEAAASAPLLVTAVKHVAHPPIRHRGTVGGSLAHADPAAELPAAALAADGELVVVGPEGRRTISVGDFFVGRNATAMADGELLAEVRVPVWPAGTGHAFVELARRYGGIPIVGVAALVHLDGGRVRRAAVALCGVAQTPIRAREAEAALDGQEPTDQVIAEAAAAASRGLDPPSDVHGSGHYRRKLSEVLVRRALKRACARPGPGDIFASQRGGTER
jgi:carbon-monoxide dehydrogenase medium subunit